MNGEDPTHHVIVAWSLCTDGLLFDSAIEDVVIVRTDPGAPRAGIEPHRQGDVFYTDALDVGESWKVTSLSDPWVVSFRTDTPGLLFLGSFAVAGDGLRVTRRSVPTEEEILRTLLDALWWTPWRQVILDRLREIDYKFANKDAKNRE